MEMSAELVAFERKRLLEGLGKELHLHLVTAGPILRWQVISKRGNGPRYLCGTARCFRLALEAP